MMTSLNRVTLIGRLGSDPDIRYLPEGVRVASFPLATSDQSVENDSGWSREMVEWSRVSLFGEALVSVAERCLHKGSRVYVEGSLQTRRWVDQQNIERYSTEVVVRPFQGTLTLLDARVRATGRKRPRAPSGPSKISTQ
jgi:single-strand DNA-binding protein